VVDGTSLLDWLLECPNHSKRRYKLLVFLLLNNNIFIKNGNDLYSFYSISDFACARVVNYLTSRDFENGDFQPILSAYYLQQVRRFS
jgi:hypothetical protein